MKYTGIDVSKLTFDCSITNADCKIVEKDFTNDLNGFKRLKQLLPEQTQVVMEASGPYYLKLATYLFEQGFKVSVVNPLIIRRFCQMRMVRTKTDKKDASMIREYGVTEKPGIWQPDETSITRLKQLNTAVELLDKHVTAARNQLEAFRQMPDTNKTLLKDLRRVITSNEKCIEKMEKEMQEIALLEYSEAYKALQTIPGIGPKSAVMLIAITGNFKKFDNYKQLVAYVGLNPRIFQSGTSVKGKGKISKMGTARVRKLLYLCSWTAKRYNVYCKEMYERLKSKAKPERVIKIAIANKLLRQAFAVGSTLKKFELKNQNIVAN
jgi:transposase